MDGQAVAVITDAVQRARGDTVAAFRVTTSDGRQFFAKTHPSPPTGFFTTEAASLAWLAESGVVHVSRVVAVGDGVDGRLGHLVLDWIEEGSEPPDEASFGRSLAALRAGRRAYDGQSRSAEHAGRGVG